MNWFYSENGTQKGPVDDAAFRDLVNNGAIRPDTPVWHEGMASWQPLSVADPTLAAPFGSRPIVPPPAPDAIQKRNLALYILLSFVTCGIFGIYWFYVMNEDTNKVSGHPEAMNGAMVILLTFITCGIYSFFWLYNMGTRIDEAKARRGMPGGSSGTLYLILGIFGLGLVSEILLQNELNNLAE